MSSTSLWTLNFQQLFALICILDYLEINKIILKYAISQIILKKEFLDNQAVAEYFIKLVPEGITPVCIYLPARLLVISELLQWTDESIFIMHPDLIKYLYQKYSDERVAHRENLRETQYLIFDDQLYYLPLQYHLIHEEEEENKLEQLEVVREENNKLFNQLKDMFEHTNVDGILWTYYNPEFIDDT